VKIPSNTSQAVPELTAVPVAVSLLELGVGNGGTAALKILEHRRLAAAPITPLIINEAACKIF
jgi:hypothetical protein